MPKGGKILNLFDFLWSTSRRATLNIIILSVMNGISGGILLILLPGAALNIDSNEQLVFYSLALPVMTILFLVSRHLSQQKTEALAGRGVEDMVMRISNTVRHAEFQEFEKFKRSDILLGIADAQVISDAADKNMQFLQSYIILFIGWLYIFVFLSPFFGIFILLARLLLILLQEMFRKIIASLAREQLEEETDMFTAFQNHLYGFKELKFNLGKNKDIFNNHLLPRIEAVKEKRVLSRRYGTELSLTSMLFHMLIMVCCASFPMSLAPDDITRIIIIIFFVLQNDMLINASTHSIAEGTAALEKLSRLFDLDALKKSCENISSPSRKTVGGFKSIVVEDVCFAYPDPLNGQGFSVRIENLTVRSGEITFIVGGNGSGKSTFINVLTGLCEPDEGVIKMNDRPTVMSERRHMFSAVFSDFHLFDQFYGLDVVDEESVREMLRLTELEGKTRYDQGSFTTLDLSTGQRKRLALIVAMMEDRPIFVFDEWAADQDPHFRNYFYENILPSLKKKGKTVVAITHDDRYFHIADQVIRMDSGLIVEKWRPEQKKPVHPLFLHTPGAFSTEEEPRLSSEDVFHEDQSAEEKQEREFKREGTLKQLRKIFRKERDAAKKILFLLPLFTFSLVSLAVILIQMQGQGQIASASYLKFALFIILLVMAFRQLQKTFHQAVENRISALRVNVMEHVRKTDLLTLKKVGAGRIYTALTSDIRAVSTTSDIILFCLQGGVRTTMIYAYIGLLYPPACVMMILLTVIGAFVYFFNHTKMIGLFDKTRDQEKKLFEAVSHLLEGFRELKLNDKKSDDFYNRSIRRHASRLRQLKLRSVHYYANNATVTYGFWKAILLIMILVMPLFGFPREILPVSVALVLTMPLRQIIDRYSQFHMAYLSILRLFRFENSMKGLGEEPSEAVSPVESDAYKEIRYKNISFTYSTKDNRPFSVGPISISFKAGEIIFITGGNGSGKSTLLNVITGLYNSDSGRVFIDNREVDIRLHRELFGPIFTDFHLFDRFYGMEKIDEAKLNGLLRRFRLENLVKCVDGKFSSLHLSTGQKKRLALIIAIMEDKPVYIFDEWAADQDPHFRKFFYKTLLPEFKAQGKTVIAVSHDDRYFHAADRALHLECGRLVDSKIFFKKGDVT
ncbi:conserved membrane hypothetical protein [Candidatus Desulfarcum epimagneticum]|uniref:Uncharacterized protein n=1 Tax=uncultured Desulfobacteraceae bacterium TaxID=218296 RepID=A0A484HER0_9BACT|nr:conserved membrane hypothetical protein [uncultured Desulfobacteraceae bacterium]